MGSRRLIGSLDLAGSFNLGLPSIQGPLYRIEDAIPTGRAELVGSSRNRLIQDGGFGR